MVEILQSFLWRLFCPPSSSIAPEAILLDALMLSPAPIIQNNFVFVPICPLADLADATDGFSRPTCGLDVPIFAVVFDDTAICIYKSLVQEMGGRALARNEDWAFGVEPTATAPSVFVRHWRSSAKKAAGCIIRPVKPEDAAERDDAQSCGIVVGLVNAGFRRFSGNLAGLRQKRSNPGGMAVYSLGRSGRLFNVAEKCNRIQIRKRWTTCWTMPGTTPNIACAAPEAESDPPRQPCVRPAGRPLQPH